MMTMMMMEEDKEEEGSDLRVQKPSHYESTDDEESETEIQGTNVEGDEMDKEETSEEEEVDELYRDVNVNLEGRDTKITDAPYTIVQTTQVIEDTHVIITPVNPEGQQLSSTVSSGFVSNMLNPSPDICIDSIFNLNTESTSLVDNKQVLCVIWLRFYMLNPRSLYRVLTVIFNLNTESTSLVDVLVTTIAETPLSPATTLPSPTIPLITHLQQTSIPTPTTISRGLPTRISKFGIVDAYLANKMHEAIKTAVQLQFDKLKNESQAENADFINKVNDNIKKIIKDQVNKQVKAKVSKILPKIKKNVNEQLEAEVLTRSSNESKTSHAVAANLSELELKKILIDKMESNKSICRSDEQKNLYKALVDAYENNKLILDTYGDIFSFKRRRDDEDKYEEPFAGSNRGSKRRRAGKEQESTSAPKEKTSKTTAKSTEGSKSHYKSAGESTQAEEPMHIAKDLEEPTHQEFKTGVTKDQPNEETSQPPDWFQKPTKSPTPDHD
ncbi:hypothetical protein Tco_0581354 [Tanacetum coccineum]